MLPLKAFVSTVVSTTGTSNTREAFARATLLLMIDWRSKFDVPKSICGWWSMNATTQLSGVRSPFSLSLGRFPFDELIHFSFVYCRYRRSYFDREDRDRSESCGVVGPARFLRSWVARKLADPMCRKVSAPSLTNIAFARGGPKWNGRSQPATLAKF